MRSLAAIAAIAAASVQATPQTLDCPLRQVAVDFAQALQPFRAPAVFQEVADALNGAQEAQNCSVAPQPLGPTAIAHPLARAVAGRAPQGVRTGANARVLSYPLPAKSAGPLVFVDPRHGDDAATRDGSAAAPFRSLERALASVRSLRAKAGLEASAATTPQATLVLRAGTFHLAQALTLGPADSRVTFQAYPGEEVFISGGVPVDGVTWTPATPPARSAWEFKPGGLSAGFDVLPAQTMAVADAQALCAATPACVGITYSGPQSPTGPVSVAFKHKAFWASANGQSTWVLNRGYATAGSANLWVADVSGLPLTNDIDGLRVNGVRAVRARYPNAVAAEDMDAMQVIADAWTHQPFNKSADYTFNPAYPTRNETINDNNGIPYFSEFRLGIGGPCAFRFTPAASYWCSNFSQGGGPGPYSAPVGLIASSDAASLPHTPYTGDVSRATVHSWRAGRWFSWVFAVDSAQYNAATNQTNFTFSLTKGGNQGSRGGDAGQEYFIENVLDELDNPGEFFYDAAAKKLYLWSNFTAPGVAPAPGSVVATQLPVLINATGTQAEPVVGVGFLGIGFRDAAPFFLGPHGTPSGGDWAVERSGALFFEGTVGTQLAGCLFTSLDANAVFFSGYNRNASVVHNEFVSIGETAIAQWGYTGGSPVPGMGFDATDGNQPRGTYVGFNLVHEVGIWTKQNSFYFQSESFGNTIEGNIAFNGPRAGINFDDGMGGGSVVQHNLLMNFCRESSDHGPFNSWNRQVYVWDDPVTGQPTTAKANDTIAHNFILANYHSSMAIDNDDGSSFYDTHHNVLWSASSGAAYGGNSLKSDFGGNSNFHHDNLDLFWATGFGICGQLPGFADGYYNNALYMTKSGSGVEYGGGQTCGGAAATVVRNNTVWVQPGTTVNECGMGIAAWQAQGGDAGTTVGQWPDDSVVLGMARALVGL